MCIAQYSKCTYDANSNIGMVTCSTIYNICIRWKTIYKWFWKRVKQTCILSNIFREVQAFPLKHRKHVRNGKVVALSYIEYSKSSSKHPTSFSFISWVSSKSASLMKYSSTTSFLKGHPFSSTIRPIFWIITKTSRISNPSLHHCKLQNTPTIEIICFVFICKPGIARVCSTRKLTLGNPWPFSFHHAISATFAFVGVNNLWAMTTLK